MTQDALYYLRFNEQQYGPYSAAQILAMRDTKLAPPDTLFCAEGMGEWKPVAEFKSTKSKLSFQNRKAYRISVAAIGGGLIISLFCIIFFKHHSPNPKGMEFLEAATQLEQMTDSGVNYGDFSRQLITVKAKYDLAKSTNSIKYKDDLAGFNKAILAWDYADLIWMYKNRAESSFFEEDGLVLLINKSFPDTKVLVDEEDDFGNRTAPRNEMKSNDAIRTLLADASDYFHFSREHYLKGNGNYSEFEAGKMALKKKPIFLQRK